MNPSSRDPTVRVRQIAARPADFDACDVGWERARRLTGIEALPADGVDDMKEPRRGGLDADQRRVPAPSKLPTHTTSA